MKHVFVIMSVLVGSGSLAGAYAFGLAWFSLAPRMDSAAWEFFSNWTLIACAGALAVGAPTIFLLSRPVGRAIRLVEMGAHADFAAFDTARRWALNLPITIGLASFLLWILPLLTLPLASAMVAGTPPFLEQLVAIIGTIGIGLIHSTFVMYWAEWYSRRKIVPALSSKRGLGHLKGIYAPSINVKIAMLVITTAILPIGLFTILAFIDTVTLGAALFLGGSSLVIGTAQLGLIASNLNRPVVRLLKAMDRVGNGDMEATTLVESVDQLGQLGEGFNTMVGSLRQARRAQDIFGQYLSPEVMKKVLKEGVALDGEKRFATVLFADIRDFTRLSETTDPTELVTFLNHYLGVMVRVLVDHSATIDKFVGDSILALFGVPIAQPNHALNAVRAGLAMLEALDEINAARLAIGSKPIDIGVGIHTGDVIAGNIGSDRKMEYTVIGDTVNTASRIEGLTKRLKVPLLVSKETHDLIADHVESREFEPTMVRGKKDPIQVFSVFGQRHQTERMPEPPLPGPEGEPTHVDSIKGRNRRRE